MAVGRILAVVAAATVVAGCGGIVDVVNEYDDGTSGANDAGAAIEAGAIDASTTSDGGTIAWGAESGTRLKAIWWKTDDGAREFAGWHDDEFGQDCTFIHATDGVDRCVPPAPYIQGYGPPSLFEDAACTIPLVSAPRPTAENSCALVDPTPGGLYATVVFSAPTGGGSCGFAFEVHSLSPTSGLSHVYGGSCVQEDADPALSYYEYGAAIPPSTFVGSKTAPEPASTRLTFLTRTTDDGARERLSLYDQTLGVTCGATQAADDTMRCLPDTTGEVDIFGDTNCATPLEHCDRSSSCDHDLCGNPVPFAAAAEQVGSCDVRFHIYPVTGTVPDGTQVYDRFGSACDPFYVVQNEPTGYVGAEADPSKFVSLESTFLNFETRLRRYAWDPSGQGPVGIATQRFIGGHGYTDIGWRDAARVEDCAITPTSDDHLRCVPATATAQAFTDDGCADLPLVRVGTNAGCAGTARYVSTIPIFLDGCARERVFEVGSPVTETTAYERIANEDGGVESVECTSFTPPEGTEYASMSADVTSQFVGFSRVIE